MDLFDELNSIPDSVEDEDLIEVPLFEATKQVDEESFSELQSIPETFKDPSDTLSLRSSMADAFRQNAESVSKATGISKRTKLPLDVVQSNIPEAENIDKLNKIDFVDLQTNYPAVSAIFGDAASASLFQDHIEELKQLEDQLKAKGDNKNSAISNMLRNAGERAITLTGNTLGFVDTMSNSIEEALQKGNMGLGEFTYRQPETLLESLTFGNIGYRSGAEAQKLKGSGRYPKRLTNQASDFITSTKLGYVPDATWETTKKKFSDGGALSAAAWGELLAYSFETGGASIVDMGAMVANLPVYIASRSKEMGDKRAKNKGLTETTGQEIAEATPFVVGSVLLDRLSLYKMLGVGKVANESAEEIGKEALEFTYRRAVKEGSKAVGFEMTTEFVQEGIIEYVGEKFGTKAKMNVVEAFDRGLAGAVAAGPMSAAIGGASGVVNYAMTEKKTIDRQEERAINKELNDQADQDKLDSVTELLQPLRELSPELAQSAVFKIQEEHGLEDDSIFISPQQLQESIEQGDYDFSPSDIENINSKMSGAIETGQDVELSLVEYLDFSNDASIRENVRLSPAGMSLADLKVAPDKRNEITSRMVEEANKRVEEKDEADAIWKEVATQLKDTGRMNSRVAKLQASIIPAYVVTKAARTGRTVKEVYKDLGVSIESGEQQGNSLEQIESEYPLAPRSEWWGDADYKERGAEVIYISPQEYLDAVKPLEIDEDTQDNVDDLKDHIESGRKLDPPVIYEDGKEDGRHRAIVAQQNGYKKIPVVVFGSQLDKFKDAARYKDSANILAQGVEQTETANFKNWAGQGHEIIDSYDINEQDFTKEKPYILKVFHATTHPFEIFEGEDRGNKEGHFGALNYFTSDEYDAKNNYMGEGPDLTNRIERRSQQLAEEIAWEIEREGIESAKSKYGFKDEDFDDDTNQIAKTIARSELSGVDERVMELFVRTEKPFVVGGGETFIEIMDIDAMRTDAMEQVADENDITVEELQENIEEYEDQVDERYYDIEEYAENPLIEAIQQVSFQYDFDTAQILESVSEFSYEGATSTQIEEAIRGAANESFIEDQETGDLISSHVVAQIIKDLGYDSIILKDANEQFANMDMGGNTAHVHVFDKDNTNIKSATDNTGSFDANDPNILRQEKRGSIELLHDHKRIIRLTEASDFSTFLHESGHLFLEMEKQYALKNGITEDQQAILDHLGIKSFEELDPKTKKGIAAHEKFAESFENYLMEGKAPSVGLRDAFRSFKRWLKQIYRTLSAYPDVMITKDVRDVFDRMLATDEEIAVAQAEYGDIDPTSPSSERATEDLFSKVYKQLKRNTEKWWNEELNSEYEKTLAELQETQVYKAEEYLRENKINTQQAGEVLGYLEPKKTKVLDPTKDSLVVAIGKLGGLNRKDAESYGIDTENWSGRRNVNKSYGVGITPFRKGSGDTFDGMATKLSEEGYLAGLETYDPNSLLEAVTNELNGYESVSNRYKPSFEDGIELTSKPRRLYGTTKKGGLDAEIAASINDYSSAEAMLTDIAESKEIKLASKEVANLNMVEKHGDILNDGSIEEEAMNAINSDKNKPARLLAELKALNNQIKKPTGINRDMLKVASTEAILKMPVSKLYSSVESYHRKEVNAAREYERLKAEGDLELATQAKMDQLLNFYLYREARAMREKAERKRKYIVKVRNTKPKTNSIHPEFARIRKIYAHQYALTPTDVKKGSESLVDVVNFINNQLLEGEVVSDIDPFISEMMDKSKRGESLEGYVLPSYKDLTVEQLLSVAEQLEHLNFIGRRLSENENAKHKLDVETVEANLDKLNKKDKAILDNNIPFEDTRKAFRGFLLDQANIFTMVTEMDGTTEKNAHKGFMYGKVYKPIMDATNHRLQLRTDAIETSEKIFQELKGKLKQGKSVFDSGKQEITKDITGEKWVLTRQERIMLAVYNGSVETRERLYESFNVTDNDINRMLSKLTDKEIDIVQKIWTWNESYWGDLKASEMAVNGVVPPRVQSVPFHIRTRKLDGGYMRIYYKETPQDATDRNRAIQEEGLDFFGGVSQTKTGAMKARKGSGGRGLDLQVNNVFRAIDDNIEAIAFQKASVDIMRLVNRRDFANAISKKFGIEFYKSLLANINQNFQRSGESNWLAKLSDQVYSNMSISFLSFSARNFVQQPIAATNFIPELGMDYAKGMMKFYSSPFKNMEFIDEVSVFMKNRSKVINKETNIIMNKLETAGLHTKLKEYGFAHQAVGDLMVAYPAWLAMYKRSIDGGRKDGLTGDKLQKFAVDQADEIVARNIGSGQAKDMSPMLAGSGIYGKGFSGKLMKMLTFMGTFANMQYNLLYRSVSGVKQGKKTKARFMQEMSFYLILPAILMKYVLGEEPEEDDKMLSWVTGAIADQGFFTTMLLRDLNSAWKGFGGGTASSKASSATVSLIKNAIDISSGDKEFWDRVPSIIRAFGVITPFGFGASQIARSVEGAQDDSQNFYEQNIQGKHRK